MHLCQWHFIQNVISSSAVSKSSEPSDHHTPSAGLCFGEVLLLCSWANAWLQHHPESHLSSLLGSIGVKWVPRGFTPICADHKISHSRNQEVSCWREVQVQVDLWFSQLCEMNLTECFTSSVIRLLELEVTHQICLQVSTLLLLWQLSGSDWSLFHLQSRYPILVSILTRPGVLLLGFERGLLTVHPVMRAFRDLTGGLCVNWFYFVPSQVVKLCSASTHLHFTRLNCLCRCCQSNLCNDQAFIKSSQFYLDNPISQILVCLSWLYFYT